MEVRDADSDSFQQSISMDVGNLVLATPLLPVTVPGQPYRFKLETIGGTPPYTWNTDAAIPFPVPGLPPHPEVSAAGEFTFTPGDGGSVLLLTVHDATGASKRLLMLMDNRRITLLGSVFLPATIAGKPFNYKFEVAGQKGSVTWEVESQGLESSGLTLNAQTGELSGTPSQAGVFTITVTASDESGSSRRYYIITVDPVE